MTVDPDPHESAITRRPSRIVIATLLLVTGVIAGALPVGCGDGLAGDAKKIVYNAPVRSRAMWVLEPATIGIGDVATLEMAVVTRPNHRVRPFATPEQVAGLWILEVETLPVSQQANRWVHRTRVRIRPREIGRFDWPSTQIEVESDGVVENLIAEGLPIEVLSVVPQYIGKLTPFGLQPLHAESNAKAPWAWAAGGAGFTLGCLALFWLARRESNRPQATASNRRLGVPPWVTALAAIETSLEQVDRDPILACASASAALRNYMDRRYGGGKMAPGGASANVGAETDHVSSSIASSIFCSIFCTTEELERSTPPFAATSRWPKFVSLLRKLDQFQFSAPPGAASSRSGAPEVIREVAAFVRDSIPNEVAR